jgi:hypothetical protein
MASRVTGLLPDPCTPLANLKTCRAIPIRVRSPVADREQISMTSSEHSRLTSCSLRDRAPIHNQSMRLIGALGVNSGTYSYRCFRCHPLTANRVLWIQYLAYKTTA